MAGFDINSLLSQLMGKQGQQAAPLKGGGLGSQAKSWVSSEQPNQPVSGEQIAQALGTEQISQVANTLGMTHEEAAQTMAATLPQVVDAMTRDGRLPEAAAAGAPGAGSPAAQQSSSSPDRKLRTALRLVGPPKDVPTAVDPPGWEIATMHTCAISQYSAEAPIRPWPRRSARTWRPH